MPNAELANAFEEAALTPRKWMPALRRLASACGAPHAQLIGLGGPSQVLFNWVSEASTEALAESERPEIHDPDKNYRIIAARHAVEGAVVDENAYAAAIGKCSSLEYVRFVERQGIRYGLQTNLVRESQSVVGLATLRPDPTPFEQVETFERAIPLAQTAVRIQTALDHQGAQLIAGTLEAISAAAFVLDALGRVRAMTPSAEDLLARGDVCTIIGERLAATNQSENPQFQSAIAASLVDESSGSGHRALVLHRSDVADPRRVDIVKLPTREWGMQFTPRTVVVVKSDALHTAPRDLLRRAFGLSEAEAQITEETMRGASRRTIARLRGVSEHTVQSQMKSIFAKTGVSREAQLIIKLWDLVG